MIKVLEMTAENTTENKERILEEIEFMKKQKENLMKTQIQQGNNNEISSSNDEATKSSPISLQSSPIAIPPKKTALRKTNRNDKKKSAKKKHSTESNNNNLSSEIPNFLMRNLPNTPQLQNNIPYSGSNFSSPPLPSSSSSNSNGVLNVGSTIDSGIMTNPVSTYVPSPFLPIGYAYSTDPFSHLPLNALEFLREIENSEDYPPLPLPRKENEKKPEANLPSLPPFVAFSSRIQNPSSEPILNFQSSPSSCSAPYIERSPSREINWKFIQKTKKK